jgi:hypothetical protein
MGSHYWNVLPGGIEIDFTLPQFSGRRPALVGEARTREYVLYDPQTGVPREIMVRYTVLTQRLVEVQRKK